MLLLQENWGEPMKKEMCPSCGEDDVVSYDCCIPDNTAGLEMCFWTCYNCGNEWGGDLDE